LITNPKPNPSHSRSPNPKQWAWPERWAWPNPNPKQWAWPEGAWPGGHVTAVDQSKIYVTEPAYLHY